MGSIGLLFAMILVQPSDGKIPLSKIHSALGCLAAQDWVQDDLRELGIKIGDTIVIRYGQGGMPNTSPQDSDMLNIALYSHDGKKAWLFFLRMEGGGSITAIRNAYALRRQNGNWIASEGNGGIGTYHAIGRYVSGLSKTSPYMLHFEEIQSGCLTEN